MRRFSLVKKKLLWQDECYNEVYKFYECLYSAAYCVKDLSTLTARITLNSHEIFLPSSQHTDNQL
jgi:hypothetical protein